MGAPYQVDDGARAPLSGCTSKSEWYDALGQLKVRAACAHARVNRLLLKLLRRFRYLLSTATCQSGYGAVCKTVYPGSIPGVASIAVLPLAINAALR